jgi:hypothetical protein
MRAAVAIAVVILVTSCGGICVGCHAGAGMDAQHTPTSGSRDEVYTPVHR